MSFAAAVDRLNLACESTFGEAATLAGVPIVGIFQAPYVQGLQGIALTDPTFQVRTSQAPTPFGATLVCSAGTFRVRSAQPDGTGWTTLLLEQP